MRFSLALALTLVCLSTRVSAQSRVRESFRDRVWRDTCVGTIRTRRGEWRGPRTSLLLGRAWFSVGDPVYGDLDGDGVDEAIVPTVCNGGGTGHFSNATVFATRRGRWVEVTRLGEGDRAQGSIDELRIERGVIIERRAITEHGSADYEFLSTQRRVLRDGHLVTIAPATLECDVERWPECVAPTGREPVLRLNGDREFETRIITFDREGHLPPLTLHAPPASELSVDAWCIGTELSRVAVETPSGAVLDARDANGTIVARPAEGGVYRVTLEATRAVGLCMVMAFSRATRTSDIARDVRRVQ